MERKRLRPAGLALALGLGAVAGGCKDLLEVQDPQRYTSEDLDQALKAVADGVEGDLHAVYDEYMVFTALASDELQHSGTWTTWDDLDKGRWRYGLSGSSDGAHNGLLRVRWFARDAQQRLKRVLGEAEAAKSPMMAQVMAVEAWSDLIMAESFCESPAEAGGPAVSAQELMAIAKRELTAAMATAQAAGATLYYRWAQAGRARANLWLGDYNGALADAQAIPAGFKYEAKYSVNSGRQNNWIVVVATHGENKAGSVREHLWPRYDAATFRLRDPYTGEPDPRLPVRHTPGDKAVDGVTPFYSQWKYRDRGADIAMTKKGEMILIEAEVYWRQNRLAEAMAALNQLRTAAGLTPHPTNPMPSASKVFEYFMNEMFAELFLEGRRMSYLHRLQQTANVFRAMNDPRRPLPRPTLFPLSQTEALYNDNIEDDLNKRCLPMSGS